MFQNSMSDGEVSRSRRPNQRTPFRSQERHSKRSDERDEADERTPSRQHQQV